MARYLRRGFLCALALLLLVPNPDSARAKGAPARAVITGPGLVHPLNVRGPAVGALGWYSLDDEWHPLRADPRHLGPGYTVTRYDRDGVTGQYLAWDHVRWYPNPKGGLGYVYYIGLVSDSGAASEFDGRWFQAGARGERALRGLLADHGMRLACQPSPQQTPAASVGRSMGVTHAFLDAYNAHNLAGVLATLAADVDYGDCDYRHATSKVMHGKSNVAAWLRARFAEHDRLLHGTVSVPSGERWPQAVAIFGIARVNDTLKAQHRSVDVAAKIGLTHNGSLLEAVRMGGGSDCPSV